MQRSIVVQRLQRRDSREKYLLTKAYCVEQVVARNRENMISCSVRLLHPIVHADFGNLIVDQTLVLTTDSNV